MTCATCHFSAAIPLPLKDVGTDRRARQKANRIQKIEQEQRAAKRQQQRQYAVISVLVVAGFIGILFLLTRAGDDTEELNAPAVTLSSAAAAVDDGSEFVQQ